MDGMNVALVLHSSRLLHCMHAVMYEHLCLSLLLI